MYVCLCALELSFAVRRRPPTRSRASRMTTVRPVLASSVATTSPEIPAPITMSSYVRWLSADAMQVAALRAPVPADAEQRVVGGPPSNARDASTT